MYNEIVKTQKNQLIFLCFCVINKLYIIFICTDDPFGENLPVYTFNNICSEKKKIKLNDDTHKIFYNAVAYQSEKNKNVKDFLEFLHTGKAESDFTERLKNIVNEVKSNKT